MTSQQKMDTPSELEVGFAHVEKIKAAITAAEADGFHLELDISYESWESNVVSEVDIDLRFGISYVDTIKRVERG